MSNESIFNVRIGRRANTPQIGDALAAEDNRVSLEILHPTFRGYSPVMLEPPRTVGEIHKANLRLQEVRRRAKAAERYMK
jgi:hypothetical protein